jgi:uncharacterized delta-60 repeat protein
MNKDLLRRRNRHRPRVEALEARALLAVAGSLDPGFGGGYGETTAPLGVLAFPAAGRPTAGVQSDSMVALPDGKILVSGTVYLSENYGSGISELAIEELNANGSLNTGFGAGGLVQIPIGWDDSFTMAVQANGQILVASDTVDGSGAANTYLVARLDANGLLDSTFGAGGIAEYPASTTTPTADRIDQVVAILPQADGRIILAGNSPAGFSAVRLDADGSLDTTYGQYGTATVPIMTTAGYRDDVTAAAIQANGQVVLTGDITKSYSEPGGNVVVENTDSEVAVIRLNTDGSLDSTYGGSTAAGVVLIPFDLSSPSTPGDNSSRAVAVQPTTGDVLVAGSGPAPITLYRLNTDGTLDTSFGTGGLVEPSVTEKTNIAYLTMAVQADGDILLASSLGYVNPDVSAFRVELIRLNPDGTPDTTFGNTSTPGTLLTSVTTPGSPMPANPASPVIQPTTGDILLAGVGTIPHPGDLSYGLTVDSILASATTGPAAFPNPQSPPADFTGMGYSDLALYDPSSGSFVYQSSFETGTDASTYAFGIPGVGQTIPAVADYQGLGFSQFAAYLTDAGVYAILPTSTSPGLFLKFGIAGAGNSIPVPADYEGTGKADVAVYMPTLGAFAILPSDGAPGRIVQFGTPGAGQSIPAPADYYNTGQDDIAVYLAQAGAFAIQDPTGRTAGEIIPFGKPGLGQSIPVPGDYDGSGQTELAVYVPSLGAFFYRPADGGDAGEDLEVPFAAPNSGAIPVPGDYDGSGHTEFAVYDPTQGFIVYRSANGGIGMIRYIGGANSDSIPVTAPAGGLSEFAAYVFKGVVNAIRPALTTSGTAISSPTSPSPAAVSPSVPAGPTLASIRVAHTLVNQEAPDPIELA